MAAWATAGCILGALSGLIALAPAYWLDTWLKHSTNGAVRLAAPQGSLWQGSGQLQLFPEQLSGDPAPAKKPPVPIPGSLRWRVSLADPNSGALQLSSPQLSGAISENPILITSIWSGQPGVLIPDGRLALPDLSLRDASGPVGLFRPDFRASLDWSNARLPVQGPIHLALTLSDLSSPLSPIKPLGSYRLSLQGGPRSWRWRMESLGDPVLLLSGQGLFEGVLKGRMTLKCTRSCEFVNGILTAVGKKNGDLYETEFGR